VNCEQYEYPYGHTMRTGVSLMEKEEGWQTVRMSEALRLLPITDATLAVSFRWMIDYKD
jgi:hypothetical protein